MGNVTPTLILNYDRVILVCPINFQAIGQCWRDPSTQLGPEMPELPCLVNSLQAILRWSVEEAILDFEVFLIVV